MSPRPVIGITLDSEEPGGYASQPWYALRRNYCDAVAWAGGLPLPLPHHPDLIDAYLDRLDGLVLTGGAFDVDPALYGAAERHPSVRVKEGRTAFELGLLRGALARDLPLLGICGGQQALAVALGGTLVQHLPDEAQGGIEHEQSTPRDQAAHPVAITPGSRLAAIIGASPIAVNSTHHQAVKSVGAGCVVDARAPDGVIEGIEVPGKRFCIGVQWHPEYRIGPGDDALFGAFVAASR
jgi:putative glutamine amidotransferase